MFDSAGGTLLPGALGDVQSLVRGHRIVETPALVTFTRLFETHSISFESNSVQINYDMRDGANFEWLTSADGADIDVSRWRTLGVWDDPYFGDALPALPMPDLLRRAINNRATADKLNEGDSRVFLRHATRDDFQDLGRKKWDYAQLWDNKVDLENTSYDFKPLDLLNELDAGSVEGFVPLIFSPNVSSPGCGGFAFGSHCVPPALYVDVIVCRNDGTQCVEIEDLFGEVSTASD